MIMSDEFYKIAYWTIHSYAYDGNSYDQKKIKKYEKRGFLGYTCSNISKWESRQIRKWAKELDKEIYVSNDIVFAGDWLTHDDKKYYIFQDKCITMHFPKKHKKAFIKLMESFPERKYIISMTISDNNYTTSKEYILKKFNKYIYRQNCNVLETCTDHPHNKDYLLLQFSDKGTAIEFKLLV